MSSLLTRVQVNFARAERVFAQLRKIILAAGEDLESHQRWLDRNRVSRAQDLKGRRQLSNTMAIWAFAQFALGLPVLLPVARFRQFCGSAPGALALITLIIITAGVARSTTPRLPAEVPLPVSPKVANVPLAATSQIARPRSGPTPTSVSGFSLIEATLVPDHQPLSVHSTVSMMLTITPVTPSPREPDAIRALVAEKIPAEKPKAKAQAKRKLPREQPQELSWWQRLPWIRVH